MNTVLEPTKDVKTSILSSDDHIDIVVDGQTLMDARKEMLCDIIKDEAVLKDFVEKGGSILPIPNNNACVVSFGGEYRLIQIYRGEKTLTAMTIPTSSADKHPYLDFFEDAVTSLLRRSASVIAVEGPIQTILDNQQNWDYLVGLEQFRDTILQDKLLAANLAIQRKGEEGTYDNDPINEYSSGGDLV